jgi:hypothetical protein
MGKFVLFLFCMVSLFAFGAGCAPKQAYTSADALGRTSLIAGGAAVSARQTASETGSVKDRMVNDIQSLKEAEKLFDEQSGIVLSY